MAKRKVKKKKTVVFKKKEPRFKALSKSKAIKTRKDLLDYDPEYLHTLEKNHPKAFNYLAQFTDEYVHANIKKIPTKKGKKKVAPGYLHKTNELAKTVTDANNHRNNDVYGVTKANSLLTHLSDRLEESGWYVYNTDLAQESIAAKIDFDRDNTNLEDKLLSLEEVKELKDNLTVEMVKFYENHYNINLKKKA